MKTLFLKNDFIFYPLMLCAWSAAMLIRYGHFNYYGMPLPAISEHVQINEAFFQEKMIDKSIEELQQSLEEEKDVAERGHIEHNIGTAYYDRYKASKSSTLLDSAQAYYEQSIRTLPTVARFHYNLGRIYTERRLHLEAKKYYEKALELDPMHVLALHNLALLSFYELHDAETARVLLTQAVANRPELPICNYVLGEIAVQQKRLDEAIEYFQQEIATQAMPPQVRKKVPVSSAAMHYARSKSHMNLALLYSTKRVDGAMAQNHLNAYLKLEGDPKKREEAIAQISKHWKTAVK